MNGRPLPTTLYSHATILLAEKWTIILQIAQKKRLYSPEFWSPYGVIWLVLSAIVTRTYGKPFHLHFRLLNGWIWNGILAERGQKMHRSEGAILRPLHQHHTPVSGVGWSPHRGISAGGSNLQILYRTAADLVDFNVRVFVQFWWIFETCTKNNKLKDFQKFV